MDSRDERWLCSRVSTIDRAVGGLQGKVSDQQELISKLTKRIARLEKRFQFWFLKSNQGIEVEDM